MYNIIHQFLSPTLHISISDLQKMRRTKFNVVVSKNKMQIIQRMLKNEGELR